jgi:hypothetical protein
VAGLITCIAVGMMVTMAGTTNGLKTEVAMTGHQKELMTVLQFEALKFTADEMVLYGKIVRLCRDPLANISWHTGSRQCGCAKDRLRERIAVA